MKQSKTTSGQRRIRRKMTALIAGLAILLTIGVGTTVAYLTDKSDEVKNEFIAGEVSCDIAETVSGGVKSSVTVKNTGNTDAYIRVAVVENNVDANGNILPGSPSAFTLNETNWIKSGNYYYYTQKVVPDASTTELLKDSITLNGIQVTILAEAIQADPVDAVKEAWGFVPGSNE